MNTTIDVGPLHVTFDASSRGTLLLFSSLNILIHSIVPLPLSSVFWVASVLLYGPVYGFGLALITSSLGCVLALPLTRSCLRPFVIRMLGPSAQAIWHSMDRAIVRERWKIPLLIRSTPVMPVVPTNFFLALTSIDEWTYAWTVTVGMIPAGIPYAYAAVVGEQVLKEFPPHDPLLLGVSVFGLVATVLAAWKVGLIATHELGRHGVESPEKRTTPHFNPNDDSASAPAAASTHPSEQSHETSPRARGGVLL